LFEKGCQLGADHALSIAADKKLLRF